MDEDDEVDGGAYDDADDEIEQLLGRVSMLEPQDDDLDDDLDGDYDEFDDDDDDVGDLDFDE